MKTKAHALISAACPEFAVRIVEELERENAKLRRFIEKWRGIAPSSLLRDEADAVLKP